MVGRSRRSAAHAAEAIGNSGTCLSLARIVRAASWNRRETRDELFPLHSTNCPDQARPPARVVRSRRGSGSLHYLGGDRVRVRQRHVGIGASLQATAARVGAAQQGSATFTLTRTQIEGLSTMGQQTGRHADPLVSMTPAQLAGVGLGTGYQLPNAQTSAAVLASMSPETRRYTESIMNLTFAPARRRGGGPALAEKGRGEGGLSPPGSRRTDGPLVSCASGSQSNRSRSPWGGSRTPTSPSRARERARSRIPPAPP